MVMSIRSFPPYLLPPADFYLARAVAGHSPTALAGELHGRGVGRAFAISTSTEQNRAGQRRLATLNLNGLSRIEALGSALIAAVGIAVLGAFVVLERRREFAILRAAGADDRRLLVPPAQEGAIAVVGSLALGIPIGLGLAVVAVRVLSLFFTLPPPLVAIPGGSLAAVAVLILAASTVALAGSLAVVTRLRAARVLREP
jgi:putative ABC transport system permease protein